MRNTMSNVRRMVFAAFCVALCVILPLVLHAIPNAGTVLLPMHIPVLLCGLICSWPYGFVCGLLGPALSCLLCAMPPAASLPAMMVECSIYGLISGVVLRLIRTGNVYGDLYLSMGSAMIVGRIAAGAAKALLFAPGKITMAVWASSYFAVGLPGIAIQLLLLPTIVFALMRAHIIPERYPSRGAAAPDAKEGSADE